MEKDYLKAKEKTMFIFLFAVCVALWLGFIIYYDKSSNHLKPP